jgi:hypothetical protein
VGGGWNWDVVDNIDETRFQINILHGWDYINMKTKICFFLLFHNYQWTYFYVEVWFNVPQWNKSWLAYGWSTRLVIMLGKLFPPFSSHFWTNLLFW